MALPAPKHPGRAPAGVATRLSRRRVSCRELGQPDCDGWLLLRKVPGGFMGPRWRRCWFVLKRHTLYWYRQPQVSPRPPARLRQGVRAMVLVLILPAPPSVVTGRPPTPRAPSVKRGHSWRDTDGCVCESRLSKASRAVQSHVCSAHFSFLFCYSIYPVYSFDEHSGAGCVPSSGPCARDIGQTGTVPAPLGR